MTIFYIHYPHLIGVGVSCDVVRQPSLMHLCSPPSEFSVSYRIVTLFRRFFFGGGGGGYAMLVVHCVLCI